jgi:lysophospholipase L1-like esterase
MSTRPQSRDSTRRLRVLMVTATIITIVLLFVAAEVAVRVRQYVKYGSVARLEEQYTLDQKLQLRVPVAGFSSPRLSINSRGFRGGEISVPKPAGTLRVAFLGASTTYCAEVSSNEDVWTFQVIEALKRAFPGAAFDEVNAGVPGYTMDSILKNLELRVVPLQPDIIVIYEAANNLSGEMRQLAAQRGIIGDEPVDVSSWPSRYSLLWYLVEKNLRVMRAQQTARGEGARLVVDPKTLGAGYRDGLLRVVRSAQQHAKMVALATFSIQPRREQSLDQKMKASASALFYMPFLHPDTIIGAYERYNEIARDVARQTGALLIEGENSIPGDAIHFNDSVHFTDAGSKVMADRIGSALAASPRLQQLLSK